MINHKRNFTLGIVYWTRTSLVLADSQTSQKKSVGLHCFVKAGETLSKIPNEGRSSRYAIHVFGA